MMIHAYQETYLSKAQDVLAEAFDYAVNACGFSGADFVKLFLVSPISVRMENGEPSYLVGKSGIEIVVEIVEKTTGKTINNKPVTSMARSVEYWIGWAIAYYQWYSGRKYREIFAVVSFEELQKMYYPLHEADITKFVDIIEQGMQARFPETNLKRIRMVYGCTQSELAKKSGVSLRSIQMYEQRNKDINKASADTIFRLSKVLGCSMEDLMER